MGWYKVSREFERVRKEHPSINEAEQAYCLQNLWFDLSVLTALILRVVRVLYENPKNLTTENIFSLFGQWPKERDLLLALKANKWGSAEALARHVARVNVDNPSWYYHDKMSPLGTKILVSAMEYQYIIDEELLFFVGLANLAAQPEISREALCALCFNRKTDIGKPNDFYGINRFPMTKKDRFIISIIYGNDKKVENMLLNGFFSTLGKYQKEDE